MANIDHGDPPSSTAKTNAISNGGGKRDDRRCPCGNPFWNAILCCKFTFSYLHLHYIDSKYNASVSELI